MSVKRKVTVPLGSSVILLDEDYAPVRWTTRGGREAEPRCRGEGTLRCNPSARVLQRFLSILSLPF